MIVTQYDVGPGAYGVVAAADGTTWTSLVERGELACVSPGGQVSRVRLKAGQSRPMVLTCGPDGAIWFSRGDGRIGRIDPAGTVSSVPVATPAGSPYGLCAGPDRTLWYTLLAADRVGRISLDGGTEEFSLAAGSMPSLITAGPGWRAVVHPQPGWRHRQDHPGRRRHHLPAADGGCDPSRHRRGPRGCMVRRDRRRPDRAHLP